MSKLSIADFNTMDKWSKIFVIFFWLMCIVLDGFGVTIVKSNSSYGFATVSFFLIWLISLIVGYIVCERNYQKWLNEKETK